MQVVTQGLIIKEQAVGESDRLVTILTKDEGVVRAFARRAKNLKDSKNAATGLLCYSRLKLSKGRDTYNVNEAFPIEVFFGLRKDVTALASVSYTHLVGAPLREMDYKALALSIQNRLEGVTWLSVNNNGCFVEVSLRESLPAPEVVNDREWSNMVAARPGRCV